MNEDANGNAGDLSAVLSRLDILGERMERMERELVAIKSGVDQTHQRAATMLYAFIMSRMSPKLLEQLIPRLDESSFTDDPWSMTGAGASRPAKWLRESVARALMNTGHSLTAIPFEQSRRLIRKAIDTTTQEERGHIFNYYFLHLLFLGIYTWERMLPECEDYEHNAGQWRPGQEYAWCVCIAAHGENGDMRKAAELAETFRRHYDPNQMTLLPESAYYAVKAGVDTEQLRLAAWVFEDARKSREENLLAELLGDKSIAIVGGGPQELGKGKGREIDSHGMVIRVNHHPLPRNAADYGMKTDIFATSTATRYPSPYAENMQVSLILSRCAHWDFFPPKFGEFAKIRDRGARVIVPTQDEWARLLKPEVYCAYTAGYVTAALIKALRPDLSTDDLYGFSHLDGFRDGYHYSNRPTPYDYHNPAVWYHNMDRELKDFRVLFSR